METRSPNEDERRKLRKIVKSNTRNDQYSIMVILVLLAIIEIVTNFFDPHPALLMSLIILTILAILAAIYFLLNKVILQRCPRCNAWGTPVREVIALDVG
jgi:hypothetical protein